ncbi:MAG: hypothetical protein RIS47_901, partial [Bacteroidota bacterium]
MRNQIRKKVYTLIISLLALGAWAQKSTINVYPLLQAPYLEQGGIIYNLPANKLIIKLTVKKLTVKTGPFKQYAEKYLGDASVHQTDKVAWRIDQIDITTSAIPDSTQYYVVATNGNSLGSLISLTDELYLQSVNEIAAGKGIDNSRITLEDDTQPDRNIPNYSRVSIKQTMVEKIDTVYRQVQTDTMIVRIPTIRRQLVEKSPEEKARELSQLLFALRDDKNALIKGEGDGKALPDGTALQQMLSEMNALEKEYLALFIGTSWTENYTYTFEYTPKIDQENDRTVLFKFATTDGILPVTDRNG